MNLSFHGPAIKLKAYVYIFFFLMATIPLFYACHSVKPEEPLQVPYLERQVNEMDNKLDEIYHRVSMIQFMVDNHERSIKNLENTYKPGGKKNYPSKKIQPPLISSKKVPEFTENIIEESISESPDTSMAKPQVDDIPQTPEMLYNKALAAYRKADYDTAIAAFNSFAEKYPAHELADNALYWIGESHYAKKKFTAAIMAFKKVVERYPEGSKIPDALLKTGYSYLSLDSKENARLFLKKVVINFPFSPAGTKAEEMLKRLN